MELSASEVYYMVADELRQQCVDRGLTYSSPLRALRQKLVRHIKSDRIQASSKEDAEQ
jgi:hypothetical protein